MSLNREIDGFLRAIESEVERTLRCLDGLDTGALDWRPAEGTSSLAVLATHVLGNVEQNVIEYVCGQPVGRDRDAEFRAQGASEQALLARWETLRARMRAALADLPPPELDREREHPNRGKRSGRELLLVAARHAAEHAGQAELTRDLLKAGRK